MVTAPPHSTHGAPESAPHDAFNPGARLPAPPARMERVRERYGWRLRNLAAHFIPRGTARPKLADFLRAHPAVLGSRFYVRRGLNYARGYRPQWLDSYEPSKIQNRRGTRRFSSSNSQNLGSISFPRQWGSQRWASEPAVQVLTAVRGIDVRNAKVLCVGVRNESELLLLAAHGFRLRNISAVDLGSASPLIQVMDAHSLDFPDDSFDIVWSCGVIHELNDPARACAEMARVVKNDGLVALVFLALDRADEFRGYFDPVLETVLWREIHRTSEHPGTWQQRDPLRRDRGSNRDCGSLILRIRKSHRRTSPVPSPADGTQVGSSHA